MTFGFSSVFILLLWETRSCLQELSITAFKTMLHLLLNISVASRVSEPACSGTAPAPGKREHNFGIFKTDYKLFKYVLKHVLVHIGPNLCLL